MVIGLTEVIISFNTFYFNNNVRKKYATDDLWINLHSPAPGSPKSFHLAFFDYNISFTSKKMKDILYYFFLFGINQNGNPALSLTFLFASL